MIPARVVRGKNTSTAMGDIRSTVKRNVFNKPVFIVAAPRSGSTLLFETLSNSTAFWTVGGEAHEIFEGIPRLRVGSPGIDSNRLTASDANGDTGFLLRSRLRDALQDCNGRPYNGQQPARIRLLEKTPKNSLRIPFINAVFPDAIFIYLYRDPRENVSSIMEAWRAGGWVTYKSLPGWEGPWSLLLPPGWMGMRGKSAAEVAAFQWQTANEYILDDLDHIPSHRRAVVNYAELVENPAREIKRLCVFAKIPFDRHLQCVTEAALPLSRYTQTPPSRDKWRKNEDALSTVIPLLEDMIERIERARTMQSKGG